ncbi:hypothetical protein U3938_10105 [Escherichia coli]|uniref:hypothetical protein n=1 Tax=Escherichia coli TaxID=562 RepID=UPI002D769BA1|nr:hypothetical protein [Escherichia coli]WRQ38004.1 hypothetical protein U3938_10105 [Escherichia coli]
MPSKDQRYSLYRREKPTRALLAATSSMEHLLASTEIEPPISLIADLLKKGSGCSMPPKLQGLEGKRLEATSGIGGKCSRGRFQQQTANRVE